MHVFKNSGVSVRRGDDKDYPRLIRKESHEWGMDYIYQLPIGLQYTDIKDKQQLIEDTLNKDIETKFDGILHIRVPKQRLKDKVAYKDALTASSRWSVPIGKSSFDWVKHDFDKIPHMTIGGMTRKGKTVLLKVIMTTLIKNNPNDAHFHFFDLKGGLEFNQYKNLKQTKSLSSNLDETLENLRKIDDDITQKMDFFKGMYVRNVTETSIKERHLIMVDEGAELTPSGSDKKIMQECQQILSRIARVSGALGYRLIFATQYPTGDTLPRQVKQNADVKIAFRVPTKVASGVCIDAYGAENIPSDIPGRAIVKTDKYQMIQVPYDEDFYSYVKQYEVNKDDFKYREESNERKANSFEFG